MAGMLGSGKIPLPPPISLLSDPSLRSPKALRGAGVSALLRRCCVPRRWQEISEIRTDPDRKERLVAALSDQNSLRRSEEHTSELQSLMRISYAVFCLKKKKRITHKRNKRENIKQCKQNQK